MGKPKSGFDILNILSSSSKANQINIPESMNQIENEIYSTPPLQFPIITTQVDPQFCDNRNKISMSNTQVDSNTVCTRLNSFPSTMSGLNSVNSFLQINALNNNTNNVNSNNFYNYNYNNVYNNNNNKVNNNNVEPIMSKWPARSIDESINPGFSLFNIYNNFLNHKTMTFAQRLNDPGFIFSESGYPSFPLIYSSDMTNKHSRRRKARTVFSDQQLNGLEKRFENQRYLSTPERIELANQLNLSESQVKTWFQNRRMKYKKTSKSNKSDTELECSSKDNFKEKMDCEEDQACDEITFTKSLSHCNSDSIKQHSSTLYASHLMKEFLGLTEKSDSTK